MAMDCEAEITKIQNILTAICSVIGVNTSTYTSETINIKKQVEDLQTDINKFKTLLGVE